MTPNPELLALKNRYERQHQALFSGFMHSSEDARRVLHAHSDLADDMLRRFCALYPLPKGAALVAMGGYGRRELYPFSDIDVVVVLPDQSLQPEDEQRCEAWVAALWNLGVTVGHCMHTPESAIQAAQEDISTQTSLLDMRLLEGDSERFEALHQRFFAQLNPGQFFLAKQLELRQRYNKFNDTPFALEPNCKESPGSLRDIHFLHWIAKAAGFATWASLVDAEIITHHEAKKLRQVQDAFQHLRIELHLLTGKDENRVLFELQPQLADIYHFQNTPYRRASEHLMRNYHRAARLVWVLCHFVMQSLRDFFFPDHHPDIVPIDDFFENRNGHLHLIDLKGYRTNPSLIFQTFLHMAAHPELKSIDVQTQRALWSASRVIRESFRSNPVHRAQFLEIFKAPRGIIHNLRAMDRLNILPAYIPEYRRVTGQMQHDLFHEYTVDQHTLRVIRYLRRFSMPEHAQEYTLASELMMGMKDHWVLYLAGLFHDIAKGRGGDHSLLGAQDAQAFAQSHGLAPDNAELMVFLVREHLLMSHTAQKKDISNPEVVAEFAQKVGDHRHLAALYLLTMADIRGTSPKVWNDWKATCLTRLYHQTAQMLGADSAISADSHLDQKRAAVREGALALGLDDARIDPFIQSRDVAYWLRYESEDIIWHLHILLQHFQDDISGDFSPIVACRTLNDAWQVMVCTPDKPGLFARISGYFYQESMGVLDARIHTNNRKQVLDTFVIAAPSHLCAETLCHQLHQAIDADQDALPSLRKHRSFGAHMRQRRTFPVPPHLKIYPDEHSSYWCLSLNAMDAPGLLYAIACVFQKYNIELQMAKVMTLGQRIEDIFLISGSALNHGPTQLAFKRDILAAVEAVSMD